MNFAAYLQAHAPMLHAKEVQRERIMTESATPVRVIEETSAYWRVVFDYPPFNIVDATIFQSLQDLLSRMDTSPGLRVVVFESANPEFYLAHFDLTGKLGNIMTAVGASGLPILMDTFVRLTKSPVTSIAKIRGCVRGVSSEFVLACDMRFDRRAIAAAKSLVNQVSLPSADRLLDAITSFETALTWPETQQRIQTLLERGLQREADFENRWPAVLGTLLET
jgi:hypothetical protein